MRFRKFGFLSGMLAFALFLGVMAHIQFSTPDLPDNDGFYHISMARLIRDQGIKPDFVWLPLSLLNPQEFSDHHFLYHVVLIPFTYFSDLLMGAKWSAVIMAAITFTAVWLLLYRQKIPFAFFWSLGLVGLSDGFLFRMSVARAQSVSLGILIVALIFIFERKYLYLGILSFFYVWTYDAFPLLIVVGFLHFAAEYLVDRRINTKPILYILTGVILGILINPYFPQNIAFTYQHILPKVTDPTSITVGNEWSPYRTDQILQNSLPTLLVFAIGVISLGLSKDRMNSKTALLLLLSFLFGWMFMQSRRFVEYFPPFALLFSVFACSPLLLDLKPGEPIPTISRRAWFVTYVPVTLIVAAMVFGWMRTIPRTKQAIADSKPNNLYAGASAWLIDNTPQGSRIFQSDWDDFPRLFFYNRHNTYLIGLDPTYMQMYDPTLYQLWVLITQGRVDKPSKIIAIRFGSEYVHTDLKHKLFIASIEDDPGLIEVYRDEDSILYQVVDPH